MPDALTHPLQKLFAIKELALLVLEDPFRGLAVPEEHMPMYIHIVLLSELNPGIGIGVVVNTWFRIEATPFQQILW